MTQPIEVHISSGATEIVRLVATILFFGGVGCLAWAVADGGYAELAGTGLSVMFVQIIRMLWSKGVITTPKGGNQESFTETKSLLTRVAGEYREWMGRSSVLRMVLLAFAYAIAFLVLRAGVTTALTVFQNVFIAGACGAIVGAFIVAPNLLRTYADPLKRRGVLNPDALRQPAPAEPPAPRPAAAPVAAPVPETTEAVVVMRRKTKED
ncbi:MAG: hypothetical protein QM809_10240 [Gordonia sp. (in: high G+C Gram-positive bacteria)]|uniref:hypothetical protein n=1 Tax=Gordonia sp. (in: high G+C Gram-positive bacteria) TaxID=84139 RepID=UPI0039E3D3F5